MLCLVSLRALFADIELVWSQWDVVMYCCNKEGNGTDTSLEDNVFPHFPKCFPHFVSVTLQLYRIYCCVHNGLLNCALYLMFDIQFMHKRNAHTHTHTHIRTHAHTHTHTHTHTRTHARAHTHTHMLSFDSTHCPGMAHFEGTHR